ncbi:hypothetical protein GCM10011397_01060 [Wenyingzhuangia marina]|nr:hypothetical protein GCM10011397_01060 [Wenyingzhuangia marina]
MFLTSKVISLWSPLDNFSGKILVDSIPFLSLNTTKRSKQKIQVKIAVNNKPSTNNSLIKKLKTNKNMCANKM